MKQIRSILSVTFALMVLLSSSSFMVGVHWCSGEIKDVALFTKAEACEKEKQLPPCHKPAAQPCCEDETVIHNGDDFNTSFFDITATPSSNADLLLSSVIISEIIPRSAVEQSLFREHSPPLLPTDLTVTCQVFRI